MRSRHIVTLLILAVLPTCARTAEESSAGPLAGVAPSWPHVSKARVTNASTALVVSGSPIASQVGLDLLRQGGNAVDAAVAVGFALAVVDPEAGNLGGGGFMVIRQNTGSVSVLDYRETAPWRATPDMYSDEIAQPNDRSVTGHLAAAVPGSVAGLVEAHRRFGRLPLKVVISPAIRLATEGFIVDEKRSRSIRENWARLVQFEATRASFLPGGRPPQPGESLIQSDLSTTLRAIQQEGSDGFYRGPVAKLIVAEMERGNGIISLEDLADYRPVWREPLTLWYRGFTIFSPPPPSSGGVVLGEILGILEGFSPLPPFGSPTLLHLEAEAMRRAYVDRNTKLGDPAFVINPIDQLLSPAYTQSLRSSIGPRATPTSSLQSELTDSRPGQSTTHYSVVDEHGNAVSATTTLNDLFGSAVTVTGAGFLLNDEMDDFATHPRSPLAGGLVQGDRNKIAPGKRMLSSMTPIIVLDQKGRLYLILGSRGGARIITQVYQVLSNVIDHHMTLPQAVAAPRIHHQALPDALGFEPLGFLEAVLDSLRARGHVVNPLPGAGDVEAIMRTKAGWIGVSDPRSGGGGAGY